MKKKHRYNGGRIVVEKKLRKTAKRVKDFEEAGDRKRNGQAGHFLPHWSAV